MAAGLDVEREKAAALSRIASAAHLSYAPADVRERIGQQEAEIVMLQNELRIAELKRQISK